MTVGTPGTPGIDKRCCCCYWFNYNWTPPARDAGSFLAEIGRTAGSGGWGVAFAPSWGPLVTYAGGGDAVAVPGSSPTPQYIFELIFNLLPDGSVARIYLCCAPGATSSDTYVEVRTGSSGYCKVVSGLNTHQIPVIASAGFGANVSAGLFYNSLSSQWELSLSYNPTDVSFPDELNMGGFIQPGVGDWLNNVAGTTETRHTSCCGTILTVILDEAPTAYNAAFYLAGSLPIEILYAVGASNKLGYWDVDLSAFTPDVPCMGVGEDCGCPDGILMITIAGVTPTSGDDTLSGSHALVSVKGATTAANTLCPAICAGAGPAGDLLSGCWWIEQGDGWFIAVQLVYDRSTGNNTFNGYLQIPPTSSTALETFCADLFVLVFQLVLTNGAGSVPGGRLNCGGLVDQSLALIASPPAFDGYTIDMGATIGLNGSYSYDDGDPVMTPPISDCAGTGGSSSTCGDYVIGVCVTAPEGDTGDTITIKLNGTTIGSFTVPGSDAAGGLFFTTQSGVTASSFSPWNLFSNCTLLTQVVISSSLFISGSNTLEIDVVSGGGPGEANGNSAVIQVDQMTSAGEACSSPLDDGYTWLGGNTYTYTFDVP